MAASAIQPPIFNTSPSVIFKEPSQFDVLDPRELSNTKEHVTHCMRMLGEFTDADPPSKASWKNEEELYNKRSELNGLAQKRIDDTPTLSMRGWENYTISALALSALFAKDRVLTLAKVCAEDAKLENDDLQKRMHAREVSMAQNSDREPPELSAIERRDISGEQKYEKMVEFLESVDVGCYMARIVEAIEEAVFCKLNEGERNRPTFRRAFEALVLPPQGWRVTRRQQRDRERALRAREIAEEENGEWDLV
tara:strand:+ start:13297 stop:14052 length:756 start_codon:yes stop_codon:yes gene_type:complete